MTNNRAVIESEELQMYLDRANALRAEAIRSSYADFRTAVKDLFHKFGHMINIPRTEQL